MAPSSGGAQGASCLPSKTVTLHSMWLSNQERQNSKFEIYSEQMNIDANGF